MTINPARPDNFVPSPQPNRTYSGPTVPQSYDPNWQFFSNLTKDQILWFQAQPEWQNFLAYVALSPKTAQAATPVVIVDSMLQAAGQMVAVAKPIIAL